MHIPASQAMKIILTKITDVNAREKKPQTLSVYIHKYVSGKKYRDSYGKRQLQNFILSGRMKVNEMCQPFSGNRKEQQKQLLW